MPPRREDTLMEAACLGDYDTVYALVHGGVNPNTANAMNGWTPLHWACKRGRRKIITFLLENGADASLKTKKGETAADLVSATCADLFENVDADSSELQKQQEQSPNLSTGEATASQFVPAYLSHPEFFYAKTAPMAETPSQQKVGSSSNADNHSSTVPATTTATEHRKTTYNNLNSFNNTSGTIEHHIFQCPCTCQQKQQQQQQQRLYR
eukprot:m.160387 g.160387  ORF g.160387 m.160387 type:complete len:210 (+) comp13384_c0_seq1:88-717(+)